jgi:outer membrane protein
MSGRASICLGLLLTAAPLAAQPSATGTPAPPNSAQAPAALNQEGQSAARMDQALAPQAAAGSAPKANLLTMERALELSKQHAPELREAAAQTEASRARVRQARAPMLPQITGTGTYTHTASDATGFSQSTAGVITSGNTSGGWFSRDYFSVGLRLTQLIWDFGQVWNSIDSAKFSAIAQEETERATQLEITYNVRNAFLTAAANKALREVSKATLDNQQRHLEQIQGFVEVGTRPQIDLAQSRTDVANAKLSLLRAENAYAGSKAELNRAMGVKQGTEYDVSDELPPPEEGEDQGIDGLVARGEKSRPEFASLQDQVRAEQEALASIKGQYGPTLNLVGSADKTGYQLDNLATNLGIGLSLTWQIFGGGITNGRVDEAHALLHGLDAQLEALRADLRLAMQQALLAVQSAQASLVTAEELVRYSKERVTLAEGRYETGVGNIIELADAELALRDAQTQYVSAEYDLATARALLRRSLGRY